MKNSGWHKSVKQSADPVRVKNFLSALAETAARLRIEKLSVDEKSWLVALLSGSRFLGDLLVANPGWLSLFDFNRLKYPRRAQGFQREIENFLAPRLKARDYVGALAQLRLFKQREMLRIAARDLARLGDVVEITRELSDVADICLGGVLQICSRQIIGRLGRPFHQNAAGHWEATPFCLLGLGKLGGQELNYSSDVDVMFVYGDEGEVFKESSARKKKLRTGLSNHQLFCKLVESFIVEVSRTTAEGFLFRVDLRLRPEGTAGPLCRSLASCENYYAQWGQTWERMMLIKTRRVAGDESLAAEFLEMIQSFRFPRSVGADVLREIAAVKSRLEKEMVGGDELERNVKLGRGGIREIEFIVQSLQVLHAGRLPFLQIPQTLPCLAKLAQYHLLSKGETLELDTAYRFLREVEHRLQMEENQQTHTIPENAGVRLRLARLMQFNSRKKFKSALRTHTRNVRDIYDKLLNNEASAAQSIFPQNFDGAETEWKNLLAACSFQEPEKALSLFKEFAEGPGYVHVSPRTTELARRLIWEFLALCPKRSGSSGASNFKPEIANQKSKILSDPDRVLTRLDSFITAYGSRATLFELWNNNPKLLELVLLLFDRSEFLAEIAIRTPDLIDDLVLSGRLRRRKAAPENIRELRLGISDADQFLWLRRYHETELMRLGLRDILGLADFEQNLAELSALADACLQYALEVVMKKNKIKKPPLAIIGLGKLGGCEIDYGSDLDLAFVADSKTKDVPELQKLAAGIMDLLSRRTEQGIIFSTDARLRPDGEKGLLVNTLDACENYYRQRARLWEIQALTRARFVAGDFLTGEKFQKLAATLTNFSKASDLPVAFTFGWKGEICQMRQRIEKERTPRGQDDLAIKTGRGGLLDAEFIAQSLCLENGWHEPNTLRALERARENKILPDAEKLIENYHRLRRVEGILRRWSYEGETVLPDDAPAFYRVSVRCGFATPEKFRTALTQWRRAIRAAYQKVFKC